MNKLGVLFLSIVFSLSAVASSGTFVGNGDDGSDLELLKQVQSGRLIDTKNIALNRLNKLRVSDIPNLGILSAEVQRSRIFIAKKNVSSQFGFDQGMETSQSGSLVYARTFAEPHADTRFFPAALDLRDEQLVMLHIHEGLHRALPDSVNKDEAVVSQITLAITAKDASFDRVRKTVTSLINENSVKTRTTISYSPPAKKEKISKIKLGYRFFEQSKNTGFQSLKSALDVKAMLYPIQTGKNRVGVGFHFIIFNLDDSSIMGPLNLEVDYLYSFFNNFKFGVFANGSFSTLNEEEQRRYAGIRDISALGFHSIYTANRWTLKNRISFAESWSIEEKFGNSKYKYDYPTITKFATEIGYRFNNWQLGANGEIAWSSPYVISGPGFNYDSGQYRLVTFGPKIQYNLKDLSIEAEFQTVINSTSGIDLDYLGDIFGSGVGVGYYGLGISHKF